MEMGWPRKPLGLKPVWVRIPPPPPIFILGLKLKDK